MYEYIFKYYWTKDTVALIDFFFRKKANPSKGAFITVHTI